MRNQSGRTRSSATRFRTPLEPTIDVLTAGERIACRAMAVTVRIPTTLRPISGGASTVQLDPGTINEVLQGLEKAHPGFGDRLFDEDGALRRFVNVFVADEDVRFLQGLDTPVADGQTVAIIPAVAGG